MPKKREYKANASKETVRQRKKNQTPSQMKKRVARNSARR